MEFSFNNKTLVVVQVCISLALSLIMYIAGRSQKTYPGFGYWTASKLPHALGWFLIGLRGVVPDLLSIVLANALIFSAPILLYSGIRKFKDQPHVDNLNLALGLMGSTPKKGDGLFLSLIFDQISSIALTAQEPYS